MHFVDIQTTQIYIQLFIFLFCESKCSNRQIESTRDKTNLDRKALQKSKSLMLNSEKVKCLYRHDRQLLNTDPQVNNRRHPFSSVDIQLHHVNWNKNRLYLYLSVSSCIANFPILALHITIPTCYPWSDAVPLKVISLPCRGLYIPKHS